MVNPCRLINQSSVAEPCWKESFSWEEEEEPELGLEAQLLNGEAAAVAPPAPTPEEISASSPPPLEEDVYFNPKDANARPKDAPKNGGAGATKSTGPLEEEDLRGMARDKTFSGFSMGDLTAEEEGMVMGTAADETAPFGPPAVLIAGFKAEELPRVRELMDELGRAVQVDIRLTLG